MSTSVQVASAVLLVAGLALPARADDAVLYLGETDPRPLEVDGRPATELPMVRFSIGALDAFGARTVTAHEARSLGMSVPEVAGASIASESDAALRSPSPGLIRLSLTLQASERWDAIFDMTPLDDDGRVRVVASGSEIRADGLTPRTFRRELGGWFLVYPDSPR